MTPHLDLGTGGGGHYSVEVKTFPYTPAVTSIDKRFYLTLSALNNVMTPYVKLDVI